MEYSIESLHCPNCGTIVTLNSKFCSNCGNQLKNSKEKLYKEQSDSNKINNIYFNPNDWIPKVQPSLYAKGGTNFKKVTSETKNEI